MLRTQKKKFKVQRYLFLIKKAESAKLPNTGEEQSTSIALLGAVLGMFGLYRRLTNTKTKTKLGDLDILLIRFVVFVLNKTFCQL